MDWVEAANSAEIARKMIDEYDAMFIKTFAECDMSEGKTANILHFHRNTVIYHLDKVKKQTGLDARRFYDLVKLIKMIGENDG